MILHLMDSDLVGSDRMKRVISEPNPTLYAYDENLWAKNLSYHQLDPKTAVEIFRLNRVMTASILRAAAGRRVRSDRQPHGTRRGIAPGARGGLHRALGASSEVRTREANQARQADERMSRSESRRAGDSPSRETYRLNARNGRYAVSVPLYSHFVGLPSLSSSTIRPLFWLPTIVFPFRSRTADVAYW